MAIPRIWLNRIIKCVLLCSIGIAIYTLYLPSYTPVISPVPQDTILSRILPIFPQKKDPDELKKQLTDFLGPDIATYSILIKDMRSDFIVAVNPNFIMTAASVNKIPILSALYYLIQKGQINPEKVVTVTPEDIQDYGTGSIRYDPPGSTYTIRKLAKLMIEQSDNTAAFVLGRHIIGVPAIQTLMDSWGLAQTDIEQNKTTNSDMALLMEKIYKEKVVNKTFTEEMLSFMANGTIQDRIPALLPSEAVAYHKTGNGVGYLHDVGIVAGPKSVYYIGIFSQNVEDEEKTIRQEAELSRLVYDFMN